MILRGTVYSQLLEMDTNISLLVPNGYQQSQPYKVAYLFHGLGGTHESWTTNTMLPVYADKYQIIFVMPELNYKYQRGLAQDAAYFKYITEELPNIIQTVFNVSAAKEDTYVIGASMGGALALNCALTSPETYGKCLAFSAAWMTVEETVSQGHKESQIKHNGIANLFDSQELLLKAAQLPEEKRPAIFMTCGTNDSLLTANRIFYEQLDSQDWPIMFQSFTGGHDWYHFNEALIKGLRWSRKK